MTIINQDTLILLDFDGTILKTDKFNWECYNIILKKYNKQISFLDFLYSINNSHLDIFFKENLGLTENEINIIRKEKYELMYEHINICDSISFMPFIKDFLDNIEKYNISHCVVTNTSIKAINLYRSKFPKLNKLKNWITREDYNLPKPEPECYKLAISRYGNNKKYILGFEDSWIGFNALHGVVDEINIIYTVERINYDKFLKAKTYSNINLIMDYKDFIFN